MHYRIEALIESDRDEGNLALFAEGVLEGSFRVKDLAVYAVTHCDPPDVSWVEFGEGFSEHPR